MDWWSLFRKVRRVIFAFIAVASLALTVVLSLYLSKEWNHSSVFQRSIVVALIGVNALTSLLLYLMIIVVFRMWKELLRVLFLLAIHIGTAVPFTLIDFSFPCDIFSSKTTCKVVALTFLSSAWSITGLLLGYTVYLCIMSRVPRPFPLVTPNDLLSTPPVSRAPSMTSVHSATRLLSRTYSTAPGGRAASPASSVYSQDSARAKTIPKRLFVANSGTADSFSQASRVDEAGQVRTYGAIDTNASRGDPGPSPLYSRFSTSTIGSTYSAVLATEPSPPKRLFSLRASRPDFLARRPSAPAPAPPRPQRLREKAPPRPLLLNPNPFGTDPLSRHGTPETALSGLSFVPAPENLDRGRMAPAFVGSTNYLTPYGLAPYPPLPLQLQRGQFDRSPSPQVYTYAPAQYMYYSDVPVSTPDHTRAHTPGSSSIHSMSPSIHFTPADAPGHPAALTPGATPPSRPYLNSDANGSAQWTRLPPTAHLRSTSDPLFRPHTADPNTPASRAYDDVMLPNPYAAGAEIRRYGSVPHVRAAPGLGVAGGNGSKDEQVHYTAGWTGHGARVQEKGIARGMMAAGDPRWREAVMKAAEGRG
ncbi:hypothetical protein BV20DRAFT_1041206 [Pilatotrama ljubarskyi]|nr:hypothetical protein BV20DRAFT_1041206 [Pilatotrama ljubarskyi]